MVRTLIFSMITRWRTSLELKKFDPDMSHNIVEMAKVNNFLTSSRCWDINSLVNILLYHIINRIKAIPTPVLILNKILNGNLDIIVKIP